MVIYDLICSNEHSFEGWFKSADEYSSQLNDGMVMCPFCDCSSIQKTSKASQLAKSFSNEILSEDPQLTKAEKRAIVEQLQDYVDSHLEMDSDNNVEDMIDTQHFHVSEDSEVEFIELQEDNAEVTIITNKKTIQ